MAKPEQKEIDAQDLADYLATESDFAFEIRTVKKFRQHEFDVQHGGTYMDAVTGKPRQFDIRATLADSIRVIRLAVECKNLRPTFPVLVSCMPRSPEESVQDIVVSLNIDRHTFPDIARGNIVIRANEPAFRVLHVTGRNSIYPKGELVGKVVTQVGRTVEGQFTVNDSEVYGKWSQALSSADDLVLSCSDDGEQSDFGMRFSCVVPVLIVPDGTLWTCGFDHEGNRVAAPEQRQRCQVFVAKDSTCGDLMHRQSYSLSHLEIVTFSGIQELLADLTRHRAIVPEEIAERLAGQLGPPFDELRR